MDPMEFRAAFKKRIMDLFQGKPWVLGIWEGGSAATGRLDDLSDLDLGLVVEDERVEETFRLFEELLARHYPVKTSFRVPEPSWHGHSQCYYFCENYPPLFYVDLLVEKRSAEDRLMEPDRHGESVIWLNRGNILNPVPTPEDEMLTRTLGFFRAMVKTLPISLAETEKQILRGNPIDAMLEYQGLVQRRLAGLLNLKYRPSKYDFGIRYGGTEYPPEVAGRVSELMYAGNIQELPGKLREISEWISRLVEELEERYGPTV
ncbi:MAG TPA: hypothetical protein PK907_10240 [Candidatus Sabulitectum sp.]|nr:hypothetical protein [Candidatus Sabulitectum sp.]HPF33384.1 hypothetical protein [Candidatus Sabulitectum sp.]HPR21488.1 hypothetical protein [Candidatus Sabulitectum sp.]